MEDIWGIRKSIGVKFNKDKANMFNVLSRGGRSNHFGEGDSSVDGGRVNGEVARM
jgi:hypothetical protein